MLTHVQSNDDDQPFSATPPPPLKPLNATQIVALLNAGNLHWKLASYVFPKPAVDDYDIVSIYHRDAWLIFCRLVLLKDQNRNETIMVVNGGSSSCGGGNVEVDDRYHYLFANSFRKNNNVTVVDRAHGARNSLHSYQLMHSFLPEHTDILLWEFSINDAVYHQTNNQTIKVMEARNQLILYLNQLARITQQRQPDNPPPLVILVYFWTDNIYRHSFTTSLAYEAHQGMNLFIR